MQNLVISRCCFVHTLSDSINANILFFTLESRLKNIRIRWMRDTEAVSGEKKLQIKKYLDTCGRGLNVGFVFGLLEDRNRSPTL